MNSRGSCTLGVGRLSTDGRGSAIDGVLRERRGGASKGDCAIRALRVRSLERLGNNAAKWALLRNA